MYRYLLVLLFFITSIPTKGQIPNIQIFSVDEYQGTSQTWNATQDEAGVMYFSNLAGVLIYNGVDWLQAPLPNKAFTGDVKFDSFDSTVYVSGYGHFGYLEHDETGAYRYHSLVDKIDSIYRKFTTNRTMVLHEDGIAFISANVLYLYDRKQFFTIPLERGGRLLKKDNQLIVRIGDSQYFEIVNGALQPTKSEVLFGAKGVQLAATYSNNSNRYLVRNSAGLLISSPEQQSIPFSISGWKGKDKTASIINILALNNNRFVFNTFHDIIVTDSEGQIIYELDQEQGILDILGRTFEDRDGHLWIVCRNQIVYIEIGAPFSFTNKQQGFDSYALSAYYNPTSNRYYIGGADGIFEVSERGKVKKTFPTYQGNTWGFEEIHNRHLIASEYGLYELNNGEMVKLISQRWVHSLGKLSNREDAFLFGTFTDGLFAAIKRGEKWEKQKVKGFEEEIRFIEEDEDQNIWISHYNKGMFRLKLSTDLDTVTDVKFYDQKDGLPSNENNRIFRLKNEELVITTINGFYQYNSDTDSFVPHKLLNSNLPPNFCVYNIYENDLGDIWMWGAEIAPAKVELLAKLIKQKDGTYLFEKKSYYKIKESIRNILVDIDAPILGFSNDAVVIGRGPTIVRYQPINKEKKLHDFQIQFTKIAFGDSLYLYNKKKTAVIDYEANDMRVEIVAVFFEGKENIRYRFKLFGYKEEWSAWQKSNVIQFTNLPEGDYTLEVEAQNVYMENATPTLLHFKVLPPLTRTWWAYLLYAIVLIGVVWGGNSWNSQRLIKQKEQLEELVTERTKELKIQTEELLQINEEMDTQRNYLEISNQKLSEYNTKIRDSINAGKIIQDAVLPFSNRIDDILEENFVLFRPRDIVSGDFYWLSETSDSTIVAVIDCTGHGVPGAFMSLLAYSLLNEIMENEKNSTLDILLAHLNERVNYALDNTRLRSKGGMDLGICKIRQSEAKEVITVEYAGAKRPLYYVENDELRKVNGSKLSIGIVYDQKRSFTSTTLELKKGTILYLTTDGYVDLPNSDREKFGTKRFEKLLSTIYKLPLNEQQIILEDTLDNFKATGDQRDDITILAFKV